MTHVSKTLPNLLGGVSQQPANLRNDNQVEKQVNFISDPVNGLVRRNPSLHLNKINDSISENVSSHIINRDEVEQYLVTVIDGVLKVFDIDGNEKTVVDSDGASAYLSTATRDSLRFLTVQDTTFILNQNVTIQESSELTSDQIFKAYAFVKGGSYSTTYTTKVGGAITASYKTSDSSKALNADTIVPSTICENLYIQSTTSPIITEFDKQHTETVLRLQKNDGTEFTFGVEDGYNNQFITSFTDKINKFSDLPQHTFEDGYVVKVIGDAGSDSDDYYVVYQKTDETTGIWKETVAPNQKYKLDASTMPIRLQSLSDGTFRLSKIEWGERVCGDEDSNPAPSFTDQNITDLFFHKDRLGFVAGETISFSEAGNYFNFYLTSMLSTVDTDRIDIKTNHDKVSNLNHIVPFAGQLLAFSGQSQFAISDNGGLLTAETVSFKPVMEFECSSVCKPVTAGNSLFFINQTGKYSRLWEIYGFNTQQTPEPVDQTSQVPSYIPDGVTKLSVSTTKGLLFALSESVQNKLYVYSFYSSGGERLVSSWQEFEFGTEYNKMAEVGDSANYKYNTNLKIRDISIIDDELFLVCQYPEGLFLEKMNLDYYSFDNDKELTFSLDRRFNVSDCQWEYNSANNKTIVHLNFTDPRVCQFVYHGGVEPATTYLTNRKSTNVEKISDTEYHLDGDWSGVIDNVIGGFVYDSVTELSQQFYRDEKQHLTSTFKIIKTYSNFIRSGTNGMYLFEGSDFIADSFIESQWSDNGERVNGNDMLYTRMDSRRARILLSPSSRHESVCYSTVQFDGMLNTNSKQRI